MNLYDKLHKYAEKKGNLTDTILSEVCEMNCAAMQHKKYSWDLIVEYKTKFILKKKNTLFISHIYFIRVFPHMTFFSLCRGESQ